MNYSKLGFKAGLEIHQQLDTPKLFSGAPSFLRQDAPQYTISRKLHAVAGESGEVDVAAAHEAMQERTFQYEGYHDTISLVELDEQPPHAIEQEALTIGLQIALLLHCEIYPVTQVMRKTVLDGSNTTGFQRTVLIGHDGWLETSFGKVPIESVALEEDSARIVRKEGKIAVYRLDRLGIPLVEIGTAPVMTRPEQVKEAALKLGELLRACKVKRGIGTIRQDVNVSIHGHERVEIKGFQEPSMFVKTIEVEVQRQVDELNKGKKEGGVRNALPDGTTEFLRPMPGAARMYPETDLPLLKIGLERINLVKKLLPKLRGDIRAELQKKGLPDELITLVLEGHVDEFTMLMQVYDRDAPLVAKMITLWRGELGTKYGKTAEELMSILSERILEQLLLLVQSKKLASADIRGVMGKLAQGVGFEQAIRVDKVDDDKLEEEIRALVKEKPGMRANAYMGLLMAKHKGTLDARKAMELITRVLD